MRYTLHYKIGAYSLTRDINEAVRKAREFFGIEDFPGNFFGYFEDIENIEGHPLFLFKEDIEDLSGFIGYGPNETVIVCLNYNRPIGHQNFTLAHEIGHYFLHNGENISDADDDIRYTTNEKEKEANEFAKELLYPSELCRLDYSYINENDLLNPTKRCELGRFIDSLCHKYFLSYKSVLLTLLKEAKIFNKYDLIRSEIENCFGGGVSKVFDKDFYGINPELPQYQRYTKPYNDLFKKIDELEKKGKIGQATAESIKLRNGEY